MAANKTILVTGANGQLGKELRVAAAAYPQYRFLFTDKETLAINNSDAVKKYFASHPVDYCINCAAYTAVDKAETAKEDAFSINATAVGSLAAACKAANAFLIHISTDYVFDGTAHTPYKETDTPHPVSIYGQSKLQGELLAVENTPAVIIIRTSWVYSSFGYNFVKTMLRLMKERESINVVNDQWGCPTYAADLANAVLQIIGKIPGKALSQHVFNYCSDGPTNWYQFALAVKELTNSNCAVSPISTAEYPTAAKRPAYSVLDTSQIKNHFQLTIPRWKDSLQQCLLLLQ